MNKKQPPLNKKSKQNNYRYRCKTQRIHSVRALSALSAAEWAEGRHLPQGALLVPGAVHLPRPGAAELRAAAVCRGGLLQPRDPQRRLDRPLLHRLLPRMAAPGRSLTQWGVLLVRALSKHGT